MMNFESRWTDTDRGNRILEETGYWGKLDTRGNWILGETGYWGKMDTGENWCSAGYEDSVRTWKGRACAVMGGRGGSL